MTIVANNQSFSPTASGTPISSLASQFREAMDSVMIGGGRSVTLHLPPVKMPCPVGCRFNQTYNKFIGTNGQPCRACGGDGFQFEPRQTIYTANIRWITEPLNPSSVGGQATIAGRIYNADVRTKMVVAAHNHILECVGAEIDSVPVKLVKDPVVTGFGGNLYYVVAFWEKKNTKVER